MFLAFCLFFSLSLTKEIIIIFLIVAVPKWNCFYAKEFRLSDLIRNCWCYFIILESTNRTSVLELDNSICNTISNHRLLTRICNLYRRVLFIPSSISYSSAELHILIVSSRVRNKWREKQLNIRTNRMFHRKILGKSHSSSFFIYLNCRNPKLVFNM